MIVGGRTMKEADSNDTAHAHTARKHEDKETTFVFIGHG